MKDENGKRYQKWISTGITLKGKKREAEEFLAEQIKKFSDIKVRRDSIDVAAYFEEWLETADRDIRQNTYRGYRRNMENHIIPYFKEHKIKLDELTAMDLEDYYYSKLRPESNLVTGSALSPTTIRHHHQNISRALSDAARKGLIPANPATAARLPKQEKFKPEFCNAEQIDQLLILFENNPVELPVRLSAIYGFRRSEVLGLKWKCVDFVNRTITISETLQQHVGGNYTDTTKTESSYRTLPMTDKAYDLLKNQIALQSQRRELLGNYYIENDYVCTMPDGEVISPNYLTRIFHSIVEHSTLPHIRFHDLRHSAASNLLNAGFSVVQVQEWLGHSSAETTLRYYGHVDKSSKKAIADALNILDRQKDAEKEILTDNLAKENSSVRLKDEAEENNKIGAQITRNKIVQLNPNTA
ncbi:MAG: site-specific integrase [Clostridia bacterium]|nr:site-specific integrase [Clostridia bacterium]